MTRLQQATILPPWRRAAQSKSRRLPLLANDSDAEGDDLSVTAVAGAINGTVMLSEDKATVTYHSRRLGDHLRQLHLHRE